MLFNKSDSENNGINGLNRLYARFAGKWHNAVLRLGYLDAYRLLIQFDKDRRVGSAEYVLDVGTGTGALAMTFLEQFPDIKSLSLLDASPEMLQEALLNLVDATCEVQIITGLLGTKQIEYSSIDTLLCAHVIEHTPDPLESLQWFHKILRPKGIILLSVSKPHWCTSLVRWRWGHQAFLPEQTCEMLLKAGFTDIDTIAYLSGPPGRTSCGFRARKPE